MHKSIIYLYEYFLFYPDPKSSLAFSRFYNTERSRIFVNRYAVRGKIFYAKFMSEYSSEIRQQYRDYVPFQGIRKIRGIFR
jgi:hypothetical protein